MAKTIRRDADTDEREFRATRRQAARFTTAREATRTPDPTNPLLYAGALRLSAQR